ncbi:MAG: hypothetical protein M3220_15625, partial [Chloroflexota bacterium]|nr:hypothetical protein [Chloroflexota bacterium]
MNKVHHLFTAGYAIITVLFVIAAAALVVFAAGEMWRAVTPQEDTPNYIRFGFVLEAIGLLTIAVASLELGQTILEEEVRRSTQMSLPTRVRRFVSRFMIVVVVSLSIEFLVATFDFIHDEPADLPYAATIGIATAALLAAWGVFVRLNRSAEELEP